MTADNVDHASFSNASNPSKSSSGGLSQYYRGTTQTIRWKSRGAENVVQVYDVVLELLDETKTVSLQNLVAAFLADQGDAVNSGSDRIVHVCSQDARLSDLPELEWKVVCLPECYSI